MDFFAQQARVRGSSRRLVALFLLAVIAIVAAIDMAVWLGLGHHGFAGGPARSNLSLLIISTIVAVGVIGLSSMYRIMSLSEGGSAVAESVGAVAVPPDVSDSVLRQLRNVIEEVAIAAGTPVPDIYLMENEPGINAFAAGYSVSDAAICVTQGCLDHLTRDELQGVIAHEFSHVLNGDMRLNIRLMGLLFGIMVVAIIGRQFAWSGSLRGTRGDGEDRNGAIFALIGLAVLAVGYIGYFFGRVIQAAVARSRESLADASAVQFTRQTDGIVGALKKILVLNEGSELRVANKHEVAHMLFGEPDPYDAFNDWYATHPPLRDRIRVLEPGFQEKDLLPFETSIRNPPPLRRATDAGAVPAPAGPDASEPAVASGGAKGAATMAMPAAPAASASFQHAGALQLSMPAALKDAAQQPESALSLALALAMSSHEELQARQRRAIANAFGDDVQYATVAMADQIATLSPSMRMPLVALAFPALKRLPDGRQQTFLNTLDALVGMDSNVDLDEYCLARLLRVQLLEAMRPRRAPVDGQRKLPACRDSVALVCAVVAASGSTDDAAARRAWLLAMDQAFPGVTLVWQTPPLDWQAPFERALDELDSLLPAAKEILIQSLIRAIQADAVVSVAEVELLRTICASLHCPLPPQAGIRDS